MDWWFALFSWLRRLSIRRTSVARWRICVLDWAGTMEKVLILSLDDEVGTCAWSECVDSLWGGGKGGTRMGACSLVVRGALSGRRALLSGRSGGGIAPAGLARMSIPYSGARVYRAQMMRLPRCYVCVVTTSLSRMWCCCCPSNIRSPKGTGGVPVRSHLRSALCRASMCSRGMQFEGISCGIWRRWRDVLMAKVPHDHGDRGLSF